MALPVAARDARVRRLIYAAAASACCNAPTTLPKSEDMASNRPLFEAPNEARCHAKLKADIY